MEQIVTAAIAAAIRLVELFFLGVKSKDLSQEEIRNEILRIKSLEDTYSERWWSIVRGED